MKKLGSVLCFVLINILLFLFSGVGFAGQEKVDVCHLTGTYQNEFSEIIELGHVINIADPAYQSHIDHGDIASGQYELFLIEGVEMCKAMVPEPTCGIPGWSDIVEEILGQFSCAHEEVYTTLDYFEEEHCRLVPDFSGQGQEPTWMKESIMIFMPDCVTFTYDVLFCVKGYDNDACTLPKDDSWFCYYQDPSSNQLGIQFHIDNPGSTTGTMSEVQYQKCRDIIYEIGSSKGMEFFRYF